LNWIRNYSYVNHRGVGLELELVLTGDFDFNPEVKNLGSKIDKGSLAG